MKAALLYRNPRGGELWQGSRPPVGEQLAASGIDVLALTAEEFQPPADAFPGVRVLRLPLSDSEERWSLARIRKLKKLARELAGYIRSGARALVTCSEGRNRSGLVSAYVLRRLTPLAPYNIVSYIRRAVPDALQNVQFVALILLDDGK